VVSNTTDELVWSPYLAIEMGQKLFIPIAVTNGLMQRGVMSPYLFAVYFDELSEQLRVQPQCGALWEIWL